ncbi:hypothetical protein RHGRI_008672 [Rhododendron griersonianum]|uniref:Uncharacterized protein n=1 Tax=Rhododendron griersonianum TaxID=479676 RepID=A0AAV6L109_9ERIC|nr:hypothetical protein RHGRI_008672 [Rhododendron griersonianum]
MEAGAGKGFECQKIMDGKANDAANALDKAIIPSCCLKARASDPENQRLWSRSLAQPIDMENIENFITKKINSEQQVELVKEQKRSKMPSFLMECLNKRTPSDQL